MRAFVVGKANFGRKRIQNIYIELNVGIPRRHTQPGFT
jgi:hypothetical protein